MTVARGYRPRTKTFNQPGGATKASLLREFRSQYLFRLVRDPKFSPKPHEVKASGLLKGNFASVPLRDGVEWFFTTREDRDAFISVHGGTVLGGD